MCAINQDKLYFYPLYLNENTDENTDENTNR